MQKLGALEKGYGLTLGNFKKNIIIFNKRSSSYVYSNRWCLTEFTSIKGVERMLRYSLKCKIISFKM